MWLDSFNKPRSKRLLEQTTAKLVMMIQETFCSLQSRGGVPFAAVHFNQPKQQEDDYMEWFEHLFFI